MPSVYFKNRVEAGNKLLAENKLIPGDNAVVSISADAALVANQVAQAVSCPLQLYLEESISVPGGLEIGSVDQDGTFRYTSELSQGHQDYFYQEFRGYIEESKRESFSHLNRELKGRETIRKDLLKGKNITIVTDCLSSLVPIDAFIESIKSINYKSINIFAPIAMADDLSQIQHMSNEYCVLGAIDFYFGADHYFEDNTVMPRDKVIQIISDTLKLWPVS